MDINAKINAVVRQEWEWGVNDCLTLVEAVAGIQRPLWANADNAHTEQVARGRCLERYDTEWEAVACYLNAGLDRVDHLNTPFKPGDVVLTPHGKEWQVNGGRLRIKPEFNRWAIGVLDSSLSVVSYNMGKVISFTPIGARWRA